MIILLVLVLLSIVLLVATVIAFFWAVRHAQFDDLENPAERIILDDQLRKKTE